MGVTASKHTDRSSHSPCVQANRSVHDEAASSKESPKTSADADSESSDTSTISLSSLQKDLDEIRHQTRALYEEQMQFASMPFPAHDLEKVRRHVDLSWSFVLIIEHFQHRNLVRAQMEIRRAMNLAQLIDDKHSIARCHYWRGRIALRQGQFHKAFTYFTKARQDLNGRVSSEEETLGFYLMICSPGISTEYRNRLLIEYSQSVINKYNHPDEQQTPKKFLSPQLQNPRKRKRELHDITFVLRPAMQSSSRRSSSRFQVSSPDHLRLGRKAVWIVQNTDDLNRKPENMSNVFRHENSMPTTSKTGGTFRVANQMKFPILAAERRKFSFRCYPIGLSGPRTRHMDLFPRQPGEPALSMEEGSKLANAMESQKVTMEYLERESEFLARRVRIPAILE